MRVLLVLLLLLPLACGRGGERRSEGSASNGPAAAAGAPAGAIADAPADDGLVDCAAGGAAFFVHACTVERHGSDLMLVSPSGGFRRLRIVPGGGVEAADGAAAARTAGLRGDRVEVEIGGDRFRLSRSVLR
jgi:hypothetical protein